MTRSATSLLPARPAFAVDGTVAAVAAIRQRLAAAPVGPTPMVEAAYAWHELRAIQPIPQAQHRMSAAARPRHLPIAYARDAVVADRLARILSALTWPIVVPVGDAEPTRYRIAVPATRYHVVTRALNKAWRQAHAQFRETSSPSGSDIPAAATLWRMALLISGPGLRTGALTVRVATRTASEMLTSAAGVLGLSPPASDEARASPVLIICRRADVVRLLTVTGASPAGTYWAS
jgi:hypothetical protein